MIRLNYNSISIGTKVVHKIYQDWGIGEIEQIYEEIDKLGFKRGQDRIVVKFGDRKHRFRITELLGVENGSGSTSKVEGKDQGKFGTVGPVVGQTTNYANPM